MPCIYVFSGPCGCGKSTLADAYGAYMVHSGMKNQVYVIHGDDFHRGFVETNRRVGSACQGYQHWPDILRFNWECILMVAAKVLERGLDVIIDYVVEDELPMLLQLAEEHSAGFYYVVLTASEKELEQRLIKLGSCELLERSLFLKQKLERLPSSYGHLYDISGKTVPEEIEHLNLEQYRMI